MNRRDFIRTAVGALAVMPLLNPAYMAAEYTTSLPESRIDVLEPEKVPTRLRELAGDAKKINVVTSMDFIGLWRSMPTRRGSHAVLYPSLNHYPFRYDERLKIIQPFTHENQISRINPEWLSAPIEVVLGYAGSSIFIVYSHRPKIQF